LSSRRATSPVLALLFTLVTACTSFPAPPASDWLTRQAQSLAAPQGKANVYVIRHAASPADQVLWTVDLDFSGFGSLAAESYLYGWLAPGEHLLALRQDGWVHRRMPFTVTEGSNYFFVVSAGLLRLSIERIGERTGRELIGRYALSGDNRFEHEPLPPRRAR
jgi:hypothetical protein